MNDEAVMPPASRPPASGPGAAADPAGKDEASRPPPPRATPALSVPSRQAGCAPRLPQNLAGRFNVSQVRLVEWRLALARHAAAAVWGSRDGALFTPPRSLLRAAEVRRGEAEVGSRWLGRRCCLQHPGRGGQWKKDFTVACKSCIGSRPCWRLPL